MTSPLLESHTEKAQQLRDAGYSIDSDAELVAAFSDRYGVSRDTARLVLAGGDDVVTLPAK